ncbi:hypothetical protein M422DRAFT_253412 [Sphaerobolus stellatus SS14]|uniref:Uncharacterized protein n=1 Tax=Sphaerobolus stellatus (strain SS14) TaxID=990650 RepID=A0A0C9V880_SPHS4|nr:hypothetical protein M422DRAFT_253412 [Sphaerobolus stellatus SS14]
MPRRAIEAPGVSADIYEAAGEEVYTRKKKKLTTVTRPQRLQEAQIPRGQQIRELEDNLEPEYFVPPAREEAAELSHESGKYAVYQ